MATGSDDNEETSEVLDDDDDVSDGGRDLAQRMRRARSIMVAAALFGVAAVTYAATRPGPNLVGDSARLTEEVTLEAVPDWVERVEQDEMSDAEQLAQTMFGYRLESFTLTGGDGRTMTVRVVAGEAFNPENEAATLRGSVSDIRAGDETVSYLTASLDTVVVRGTEDGLVVTIAGPVRDEVVAMSDAMITGPSFRELPGAPQPLITGTADTMDWQVILTRPGKEASGETDGTCVSLRWYTSSRGCVAPPSGGATITSFPRPHDATANTMLFVRAGDSATSAVVVQASGARTTVALAPLSPATGRALVLISPLDDPVVEVVVEDATGAEIDTLTAP